MTSTFDGLSPIDVTATALPDPSSGGSSGGGWSTFLGGLGTGLGSLAINTAASKLNDVQGSTYPWAMPDQAALRYGYAGAYGVPANGAPSSGISTTTIVVLAVVGIVGFVVLRKVLR